MNAVLVTGVTGFLGGALARRMRSVGYDVIATGRSQTALCAVPLPDTCKIALDLSEPLPLDALKRFEKVKTIVHCAALSSAWGRDEEFWKSNVDVTQNLLNLAKQLDVRHMVHISTPAVYFQFEDQFEVSETKALPTPVNSYARTKAIAEERVLMSGVSATIIRPRGIYGVGDSALMPRLLRAAESGPLPRFRDGCVQTDITYIDDVVDAVLATIEAGDAVSGEVLNVSGGVEIPIVEIVERACAAHGTRVRWRNLPIAPTLALIKANEKLARLRSGQPEPRVTAYGLGVFAYSQTLDISKAKRMLNWTPKISFDEGLKRTFQSVGRE